MVDPSIIECCLASDPQSLERLSAMHPSATTSAASAAKHSPLSTGVVMHDYQTSSPNTEESRLGTSGHQLHPTLDTTSSTWESAEDSPRPPFRNAPPPAMIMTASPAARPVVAGRPGHAPSQMAYSAGLRESTGQDTFANMFWFPSSLGSKPGPHHELHYGPVATDSPTGSQRAARFSPRRSAVGVNPRVLMERLASAAESADCHSPV